MKVSLVSHLTIDRKARGRVELLCHKWHKSRRQRPSFRDSPAP